MPIENPTAHETMMLVACNPEGSKIIPRVLLAKTLFQCSLVEARNFVITAYEDDGKGKYIGTKTKVVTGKNGKCWAVHSDGTCTQFYNNWPRIQKILKLVEAGVPCKDAERNTDPEVTNQYY